MPARRRTKPDTSGRQRVLGVLLASLSLLLLASLLSAPVLPGARRLVGFLPPEACGLVGRAAASALIDALGLVPALVPVVLLAIWGLNRLRLASPLELAARTAVILSLTFFVASLLGMVREVDGIWVGAAGSWVGITATQILGTVGANVVLWAGLLVSLMACLDLGVTDVVAFVTGTWCELRERLRTWRSVAEARERAIREHHASRREARVEAAAAAAIAGSRSDEGASGDTSADVATADGAGLEDAAATTSTAARAAAALVADGDLRRLRRQERARLAALIAADRSPPRVARVHDTPAHAAGIDAQADFVAPWSPPGAAPAMAGAAPAAAGAPTGGMPTASGGAAPRPAGGMAGDATREASGRPATTGEVAEPIDTAGAASGRAGTAGDATRTAGAEVAPDPAATDATITTTTTTAGDAPRARRTLPETARQTARAVVDRLRIGSAREAVEVSGETGEAVLPAVPPAPLAAPSLLAGQEADAGATVVPPAGAAAGASGTADSPAGGAAGPATGGSPAASRDAATATPARSGTTGKRATATAGPRRRRHYPRGTAYRTPDAKILTRTDGEESRIPESDLLKNSRLLERTLSHFDITGKVTEVTPGPVITRFAFEPAPGIRVNQILSRADDLALAMRAHRLRILAPIPGKAAVGIEVPNPRPEMVRLGDLVRAKAFDKSKSTLLVALGKDVSGVPVVADLERMPHVLIAGATGTGKSVCVNALISSLLVRLTPRQLRLVMVDPKLIELTCYDGVPHLLMPVVTEAKRAARALRYMVQEMQQRYDLLSRLGVRNIEGFNEAVRRGRVDGYDGELGDLSELDPLPYVVIVIDELADLMLTLGNEIEDPIARLAQMARAVGIHLVLATQRPSVDVITGIIKANFPSRIAFQVATKVDSRTILDQNGAEVLLGRGDMLYLPAGRPDAIRIHGSFVSDREIHDLVRYWREFAPPTEEIDLDQVAAAAGGRGQDEETDELFEDARRIVIQTGIGSTSMLQRRLKVGYARAGRLMDLLEQAGVVGPPEGSKAREVLIKPTDAAASF